MDAATLKLAKNYANTQIVSKMDAINANHFFADDTARDAYFGFNPTELVEGVLVSSNDVYQMYNGSAWVTKTPISGVSKGEFDAINNRNPIYVADYGVSYLNTAEVNTPLFKQALSDAELQKRPVVLPWCPTDAFIEINDTLITTADKVNIIGYGRNTRIKQIDNTKGILYMQGMHSCAKSFEVYGTPFEKVGSGSTHIQHFGVRITNSYGVVDDVYGDILSTLVLVGLEETALPEDYNVGTSITNVESGKNIVFNLLVSRTKDFRFDKIMGSYSDLAETPPHLIYVDNSSGYDHYNMQGGYCHAWDGVGSFAYQFKGCVNGNAGILTAVNCKGIINIMDSRNFGCREIESIDDTSQDLTSGAITLQAVTKNDGIRIDKATVKMGDGKAVYLNNSDNCIIKDLNIETNHTSIGALYGDVDILGSNNNKIVNPIVKNIGDIKRLSSIRIRSSQGNVIDNPATTGNESSVCFDSNNIGINKLINFDINKQDSNVFAQSASIITLNDRIDNRVGKSIIAYDDALATYDGTQHLFTNSGHKWIIKSGTLMTNPTNGTLYGNSGVSNGNIAVIDALQTNVMIDAEVVYKDWDAIVLKFVDLNNYLCFIFNNPINDRVALKLKYGGVVSYLESIIFPVTVGRRYRLKVIVYGDNIKCYIDGDKLIDVTLDADTMTALGTSTLFGIYGRNLDGGKWSKFKLYKLN